MNKPIEVMLNEFIRKHRVDNLSMRTEELQVLAQIVWNEAHYQGYNKGVAHGWEDAKKLEKEIPL